MNNNKPEAYECLMERLEDLEDTLLVMERRNGPFVNVALENLGRRNKKQAYSKAEARLSENGTAES